MLDLPPLSVAIKPNVTFQKPYFQMNFPASRLQRILAEAPVQFRMGDYISRGFQVMNDNFGMLIGFVLVSAVINFLCQSLPYVGLVLSMAISPVLSIGYSQFAYMVSRGHKPDFGEFFKGFSKIGPLVLTYLLVMVVSLIAILPGLIFWYQAGMAEWLIELMAAYPFFEDIPSMGDMVDMSLFGIGLAVILLGGLIIGLFLAWALQIAWFFEVGPMEALDASRKLIARNWTSMLGFLIFSGLIAISGVLLCGVGVLYTAPAVACAHFFAFADSTHILDDEDDNKPDLIDHFIA
ncbi:MAG: hypothetical protein ACKVU0_02685 [Saprospiraceae bacterium]